MRLGVKERLGPIIIIISSSSSISIIITLFTLHFVTKKARTTETTRLTWREHDVNIVCDWLTPHPAAVFHSFWPGRNRACPGNTGHEKEREIFDRLLKERFSRARSLPGLNRLLIKNATNSSNSHKFICWELGLTCSNCRRINNDVKVASAVSMAMTTRDVNFVFFQKSIFVLKKSIFFRLSNLVCASLTVGLLMLQSHYVLAPT